MHYVYIIQSQKDKNYYVGLTESLETRLKEHNRGNVEYTSAKTPYVLVWYCVFKNKKIAANFEQYLKQGSGHAFARKHLL